jgi:AcrR family transcriptional regulator
MVVALEFRTVNTVVYGKMRGNRLGPGAWVNAGLKTLAKSGFAILKADTLAKTLGISRGSFYWHFADVSAFHAAILRRWREIALENIIAEIDGGADDRLEALLYRAFSAAGSGTERAVRAWATADPQARAAVEAVDGERLRYLRKLLIDAGVHPGLAETRARIIYSAYLGFALSASKLDQESLQLIVTDLSQLARLKLKRHSKRRFAARPPRRRKRQGAK